MSLLQYKRNKPQTKMKKISKRLKHWIDASLFAKPNLLFFKSSQLVRFTQTFTVSNSPSSNASVRTLVNCVHQTLPENGDMALYYRKTRPIAMSRVLRAISDRRTDGPTDRPTDGPSDRAHSAFLSRDTCNVLIFQNILIFGLHQSNMD